MESALMELGALNLSWLGLYLLLGGVVGLFAGLFGIGGGGIMVPLLTLMFMLQGVDPSRVVHMALATSMAAILVTALSSARAHHSHGAVKWEVVAALAPGVLAGTFLAAYFTSWVPSSYLAGFFVLFIGYVSVRMFLQISPNPSRHLPGWPVLSLTGAGIGSISALVAIGGGSLTVPFLSWCNVPMQKAIGTSAAVGVPIAAAGTVGYLAGGAGAGDLPVGSFGYIYLPAALSIAFMSMLTAPAGARLAHRLPVMVLRRLFAILLMFLALQMLYSVVAS